MKLLVVFVCFLIGNSVGTFLYSKNCDTLYTDWNDAGIGRIQYHDRHDIACGSNKAITAFKVRLVYYFVVTCDFDPHPTMHCNASKSVSPVFFFLSDLQT